MKLMTIALATFALVSTSVHAESKSTAIQSDAKTMAAGFTLGLNMAKFSGTAPGISTLSNKLGFKFGGQVEFQLGDWFFLEPGLMFTMKGAKSATDVKTNLNYLSVPVLMKAKFDAGGWSPYLLVGPSFGIAMSRNVEGVDASTTYKSIDFGLDMGAGAAIPVGDGMSWFLDGRFELGLSNILESAAATALGDATYTVKNQNISINTGLNFAL